DDMSQLAKLPGIRNEDRPGYTTFGIKFNCQNGPTADINLRKAIAYAFDYEALITIHNGGAQLMTSPFPPDMEGYVSVPDMPRGNLEKAKEYLAKSRNRRCARCAGGCSSFIRTRRPHSTRALRPPPPWLSRWSSSASPVARSSTTA